MRIIAMLVGWLMVVTTFGGQDKVDRVVTAVGGDATNRTEALKVYKASSLMVQRQLIGAISESRSEDARNWAQTLVLLQTAELQDTAVNMKRQLEPQLETIIPMAKAYGKIAFELNRSPEGKATFEEHMFGQGVDWLTANGADVTSQVVQQVISSLDEARKTAIKAAQAYEERSQAKPAR